MQRQKETDNGECVWSVSLISDSPDVSTHVYAVIQYTCCAHLAHSIPLYYWLYIWTYLKELADIVYGVTWPIILLQVDGSH